MTKFFLETFYIMGYNLKNARNTKMAKFESPGMKE